MPNISPRSIHTYATYSPLYIARHDRGGSLSCGEDDDGGAEALAQLMGLQQQQQQQQQQQRPQLLESAGSGVFAAASL
eukprot:scaffold33532_cov21-Tisochrysis_lutea.AAC.3